MNYPHWGKIAQAKQAFDDYKLNVLFPETEHLTKDRALVRASRIRKYNEDVLGITKKRTGKDKYVSYSPLSKLVTTGNRDGFTIREEIFNLIRNKPDFCGIVGMSIPDLLRLPWSEWNRVKDLAIDLQNDEVARLEKDKQAPKENIITQEGTDKYGRPNKSIPRK